MNQNVSIWPKGLTSSGAMLFCNASLVVIASSSAACCLVTRDILERGCCWYCVVCDGLITAYSVSYTLRKASDKIRLALEGCLFSVLYLRKGFGQDSAGGGGI